jgi:hypothetical protein
MDLSVDCQFTCSRWRKVFLPPVLEQGWDGWDFPHMEGNSHTRFSPQYEIKNRDIILPVKAKTWPHM